MSSGAQLEKSVLPWSAKQMPPPHVHACERVMQAGAVAHQAIAEAACACTRMHVCPGTALTGSGPAELWYAKGSWKMRGSAASWPALRSEAAPGRLRWMLPTSEWYGNLRFWPSMAE